MRTLWLLALAGCGGAAAAPAPVDNTGGATTPHAPCYPDRATVTARVLFDAANAGAPGTCTLAARTESRGGESEWEVRAILDGDDVVATLDPCGLEVRVAGVLDDRGIGVGDDAAAIEAAYPPDTIEYTVAAGLGGEAQLSLHMDGLDLAWFTLDGMGPDTETEGVEAIAGQHVASYRTSFACD